MSPTTIERITDHEVWEWVEEGTRGRAFATASAFLPCDAAAMGEPGDPSARETLVRVFHPTQDEGLTWAQVAARNGRTAHALMQWCGIEPRAHHNGPAIDEPDEGSTPPGLLDAILAHCRGASASAFHAVWDGFGTWTDSELVDGRPTGPLLRLPGRKFRVFRGPVAELRQWPGMEAAWDQSANLVWPEDRSWVIATEIDWPFTLVAAPERVAAAILADPALEAYRIDPDDDLSMAGDTVNPAIEHGR